MYVKVHAIPDAKKEIIEKENDTIYQISVKEPAERNLANGRIRELLCAEFGLERGKVRMISGHRSPNKIFSVDLST